jgi:hypothetical protein
LFIDKEVSASAAAGRGPRLLAHVVGPAKDQPLPKLERFWPGPIGLFVEIHNPIPAALVAGGPKPG